MATAIHEQLQDVHSRWAAHSHAWVLAELIIEIGGIILSALDGLNAAITNLQAQVTAENAELTEVVNGLVAAREQIQALQDQLNSGTQVTVADLDAVTQTITQVADSAAAATAAAATATTPPAPPTP